MMHSSEHIERETLMLFEDGRLAADVAAQCRAHLAECPECRHELSAMVELEQVVRMLPGIQPSPDFTDGILARCIPEVPANRAVWGKGTERRMPGVWLTGLAVPLGLVFILSLVFPPEESADSSGALTSVAAVIQQELYDVISWFSGEFWSLGLMFLLSLVLLALVDQLVGRKQTIA